MICSQLVQVISRTFTWEHKLNLFFVLSSFHGYPRRGGGEDGGKRATEALPPPYVAFKSVFCGLFMVWVAYLITFKVFCRPHKKCIWMPMMILSIFEHTCKVSALELVLNMPCKCRAKAKKAQLLLYFFRFRPSRELIPVLWPLEPYRLLHLLRPCLVALGWVLIWVERRVLTVNI